MIIYLLLSSSSAVRVYSFAGARMPSLENLESAVSTVLYMFQFFYMFLHVSYFISLLDNAEQSQIQQNYQSIPMSCQQPLGTRHRSL